MYKRQPEEYTDIFSQFGTVVSLLERNFDWKSQVQKVVRPPAQWHFQFNPSKRFYLKRSFKGHDIRIKGEVNYRSDFGMFKRFCKKGFKFRNLKLLAPGVGISALKSRDIDNLLTKHFGGQWKSLDVLKFYKNIVDEVNDYKQEIDKPSEHALCDQVAEENSLMV